MPWAAAAGAAAGYVLNSTDPLGGNKPKTAESSNAPWLNQQAYLQHLFDRGESLYNNNPNTPTQSPYTQQAIQRAAGSATNPNSLSNQSAAQFGKTIQGDYLSADSNPYLKGTVDRALNDVQSRVAGTFGTRGGNNYGSSAHQEWLGRSLAETALPIYAQNYQGERARQLNAAQQAPGMEAGINSQLAGAGAQEDAYQASLRSAPWDQLARYQAAITGNYGGLQSQQYYGPNSTAAAAGGALLGQGLYNQSKTQQQSTNPWNPYQNYAGAGIGQADYSGGFY